MYYKNVLKFLDKLKSLFKAKIKPKSVKPFKVTGYPNIRLFCRIENINTRLYYLSSDTPISGNSNLNLLEVKHTCGFLLKPKLIEIGGSEDT